MILTDQEKRIIHQYENYKYCPLYILEKCMFHHSSYRATSSTLFHIKNVREDLIDLYQPDLCTCGEFGHITYDESHNNDVKDDEISQKLAQLYFIDKKNIKK